MLQNNFTSAQANNETIVSDHKVWLGHKLTVLTEFSLNVIEKLNKETAGAGKWKQINCPAKHLYKSWVSRRQFTPRTTSSLLTAFVCKSRQALISLFYNFVFLYFFKSVGAFKFLNFLASDTLKTKPSTARLFHNIIGLVSQCFCLVE